MCYFPAHQEDDGRIPTQGGPQVDGESSNEEYGWYVVLPPTGEGDGRGCPTGGVYLHFPLS